MQCERCHKAEACIHLTQVVNGEVRKLHLCEKCAAEAGFDLNQSLSISDLLAGQQPAAETPPQTANGGSDNTSCPKCGLKRSDFRTSGRLGCPDCYATFSAELHQLIRAVHHSLQHCGKVAAGQSEEVRARTACERLQQRLQQAIDAERFEEAAELRDRLRELRQRGETQSGGTE